MRITMASGRLGRFVSVGLALAAAAPASAQYTWTGPNNGSWNNGTNWLPVGGPPHTSSATATFDGTSLGTANIGATVSTQSLLFSNPTGNQTITSTAGTNLNSVTSITVDAAVTGVETINLANSSTGSLLFPANTNLTFTNNSTAAGTTLVIGPNTVIGASGNGGVVVTGAGNTQISGSFATAGNSIGGGLTKTGAGTLILSNPSNYYLGGTFVNAGKVVIGATGTVLPAGQPVTVAAGAVLDYGPYTNTGVLSSLNLAGTLRATGATSSGSDISVQQLAMTGGKVDFGGLPYTWLHIFSAAGITTSASATTATLIGSGNCQLLNDAGNVSMPITVAAGALNGVDLDASLILACRVSTASFNKLGNGTMRLSNTGNTANIICSSGLIVSNDLSTNVGAGAFGTLGTGKFTLANGSLAYDGPTATSAKLMTITSIAGISIAGPDVNLTLQGIIGESAAGAQLLVSAADHYDPVSNQFLSPGTLSLTANNAYTGPTVVTGNCILAIPTIANGNASSPIGKSSSAAANLQLSGNQRRGLLLLTGTDATYSTDRGVTLYGLYDSYWRGGGAIGVANHDTTLTWSGQITEFAGSPASFTKTGDGTLTFTNTTNNYTGGTFVEGGTLNVGVAGAVIPTNSDVTVSPGATFRLGFTSGDNAAAPLRTLTLNGGTLLVPSGDAAYSLNKLVMTAGTVDFTGSGAGYGFGLVFGGAGAAITTKPSPATATWIGSNNSYIDNNTGGPMTVTVKTGTTASGIDLDAGIALFGDAMVKAGAGTMRLTNPLNYADFSVQQGRLRVDDVTSPNTNAYPTITNYGALGSGALTLDGGTLQYAGPTVTLTKPLTLASTGGLEVSNAATTLTLTSPISGGGGLTKTGPGVLVLGATGGSFAGGFTVTAGRVEVADDARLGAAAVTVNPAGTLRYTANTTTGRMLTLNGGTLELANGVTLTLNGAAVYGGFLRGAGTFAVTGDTAVSGTTTFASTTINVTGAGSFSNFANGGPLVVAADLAAPVSFNGFTNKVGGQITVGARSAVGAADFEAYGTLSISPATVTQDFSQTTLVTNAGSSPLNFGGGSRTFIGTPATAVFPQNWPDPTLRGLPTFVAGIDLNGKNAVVAGGLFVNNGYIEDSSNNYQGTATVIADFGALVKGAGYFQNTVQTINGGKFQAGNSPGKATFGSFVLGPGGVSNYVFAIDDAVGTAGPSPDAAGHVSGWGLVKVGGDPPVIHGPRNTQGDFVWTATPADKLTVAIDTLINPTTVGIDLPGMMDHFDPSRPYAWAAVAWTGSYAGPADIAALNAATAFDTGGFANPVAGVFGWQLDVSEHTLSLVYTPAAVPEPGTLTLILTVVAPMSWLRFRGRCRRAILHGEAC